MHFSPTDLHAHLLANAPRILQFDPAAYLPEWQSAARRTFKQLLGPFPVASPLQTTIEFTTEHDAYTEIRFTFLAEKWVHVPCHLLLPKTPRSSPPPLVICLQGHSPGMHISLGRAKNPAEEKLLGPHSDRDLALQAVGQGYAALALEQRGFGERAEPSFHPGGPWNSCHHAAMNALLLGRPLIGQRVFDITRAIDCLLESFAGRFDVARIAITGQSGGGTVAYYAAAIEPRLAAVVPCCSICTYADSIAPIHHCADNYLPNVLHYFEMSDLAGLIAPRPLLVLAGKTDELFPLAGVERCFGEIQTLYTAFNAPEKTRLLIGDGGHRYYAPLAWPALAQLTGW